MEYIYRSWLELESFWEEFVREGLTNDYDYEDNNSVDSETGSSS